MAAVRRTRWVCPDCGRAQLAPRRLRRVDVRRYCLPCSKKAGVLVERSAPVNEKRRERSAERSREKQKRAREREVAAKTIRTVDAAGRTRYVNVEREVLRMAKKIGRKPEVTLYRRRTTGGTSGRCFDYRVHITTEDGERWERLQYVMAHEVAHIGMPWRKPHGRKFRENLARLAPKVWPGIGRIPAAVGLSRQEGIITERLEAMSRLDAKKETAAA